MTANIIQTIKQTVNENVLEPKIQFDLLASETIDFPFFTYTLLGTQIKKKELICIKLRFNFYIKKVETRLERLF